MRTWAGHVVFAVVLIGSVAARERGADLPADDVRLLEPAIVRVAGSHGLNFRGYRTTSGIVTRTLVFDAPGCSQPVRVSPRQWTFEEESLRERVPDQAYTRRYIYFDRSWHAPDPQGVFVQGMKYRALAMFGLTDSAPSRYLLLVEAPKNCRGAEAVDWRDVWNRSYLAAAHADGSAASGQ